MHEVGEKKKITRQREEATKRIPDRTKNDPHITTQWCQGHMDDNNRLSLLVYSGGNTNGVQGRHEECVRSDLIFYGRAGKTSPLK